MRYKKRRYWKYSLVDFYSIKLPLYFPNISHPFFNIKDSILSVHKKYCWDGATCAIDTENFMIPSLVHDVLSQAMREGVLHESYFKINNEVLYLLCRDRGMSWVRARYVKLAVDLFGKSSIKSDILEVPDE